MMNNENSSEELVSNKIAHRELSRHYYKNRTQLTLYSGLLLAWELIGLTIPSKPFINSNVEIKNPEAFPIVLLILILYFSIEH